VSSKSRMDFFILIVFETHRGDNKKGNKPEKREKVIFLQKK
jgi:hypothetical protein